MTLLTNTTTTYGVGTAGGNREDLEDVIWDLEPLDTYCLTSFDKVKAQATFHEWPKDALVAPASNIGLEGDDFAAASITQATRVGNYCQIFRKQFLVSGTQEAVKSAGRASDVVRQRKKQMMELKNDMEYAIVRNQASSAGGATTARSSGGMESWIASTDNGGNGVRATTSAAASTAAYSSGVTAPTDGSTTGALTVAALNSALSLAWADGGDPSIILCDSTQKQVIDTFAGIATRFIDVGKAEQATIIGAANVYVSSFGKHTVVMHRHVRASVVMCIDPEYWAIAFLRRPFKEQLAKTGDAEKHMILTEFTLVSRNASASAKVAACA